MNYLAVDNDASLSNCSWSIQVVIGPQFSPVFGRCPVLVRSLLAVLAGQLGSACGQRGDL